MRVATAELEALEPMTRSPSWWPGTRRPSTSAGRCPIGTAAPILPPLSPRARGPRRPRPDRDRVHDLAAHLAAAAGPAQHAAGAQAGLQLALELPARVDVDRLVDALVADLHPRIAWVIHFQPPADLLG